MIAKKTVTNEHISKVSKLLLPTSELLIQVMKDIDKIDMKGYEHKIAIKLFLCSYIDNFDEVYNLITGNRNSGIANYLRTQTELVVYMKCLQKDKDTLNLLKNKNYGSLKVIRSEFIKKNMAINHEHIKSQIDILQKRISENSLEKDNLKKLTLSSSIENYFDFVGLGSMYTIYFRPLSRMTHVNIFDISERYKQEAGLEIKPKLTYDLLILYLLTLSNCNAILIEIIKEVFNYQENSLLLLVQQNEKLIMYLIELCKLVEEKSQDGP